MTSSTEPARPRDTDVRAESARAIEEISNGEYVTSTYVEEALGLNPATLRGYVAEFENGGRIKRGPKVDAKGKPQPKRPGSIEEGVYSAGAAAVPRPTHKIRATVWLKSDVDAAAARKHAEAAQSD